MSLVWTFLCLCLYNYHSFKISELIFPFILFQRDNQLAASLIILMNQIENVINFLLCLIKPFCVRLIAIMTSF